MAALGHDLYDPAENGTSRRCAETYQDARLQDGDLGNPPRPTRRHFDFIGFLMQAPLSARLPLEVFDRIGDVALAPVNAGCLQSAIEKFACGANEGTSLSVFLVARLFANEDDFGASRTFTKYRLCSVSIEGTSSACKRCFTDDGEIARRRDFSRMRVRSSCRLLR